jgi:hypothetical protein
VFHDLTTYFCRKEIPYTGKELRPHFLLTELGLKGTGIGAFIGPCKVETENLVDWEDRLAKDRIEAKKMVHFIGEFFGTSLREGVLIQRLFMSVLADVLHEDFSKRGKPEQLWRDGDDLMHGQGDGKRKLSVSIVTASPVSQLLHVGINIDPTGAPVPAIGLEALGVDPMTWVPHALEKFSEEWKSIEWACVKVRPVIG